MQTVKHFVYGLDRITGNRNSSPLEQQMNDFLDGHPNYKITSFSTIIGPDYKEAFVVFDIREDKKKDDLIQVPYEPNKPDQMRKHIKQAENAINNRNNGGNR